MQQNYYTPYRLKKICEYIYAYYDDNENNCKREWGLFLEIPLMHWTFSFCGNMTQRHLGLQHVKLYISNDRLENFIFLYLLDWFLVDLWPRMMHTFLHTRSSIDPLNFFASLVTWSSICPYSNIDYFCKLGYFKLHLQLLTVTFERWLDSLILKIEQISAVARKGQVLHMESVRSKTGNLWRQSEMHVRKGWQECTRTDLLWCVYTSHPTIILFYYY